MPFIILLFSMITTEQVKDLRDKTGVSIMQCKKALEDAGGDFEKALVLLKKKGAEIAEKKGDRTLAAGAIGAYIHASGNIGGMSLTRTRFWAAYQCASRKRGRR